MVIGKIAFEFPIHGRRTVVTVASLAMGVVKRQTAVASQELDRRYIGIELDPLYVRQAQKCLRLTGNRLTKALRCSVLGFLLLSF